MQVFVRIKGNTVCKGAGTKRPSEKGREEPWEHREPGGAKALMEA